MKSKLRGLGLRPSIAALCFVMAITILSPVSRAHAEGFANFHRGVALFHPMIYAPRQNPTSERFVFPPFSDARSQMTGAQLTAIRKAGFDFVRLPVNPGP